MNWTKDAVDTLTGLWVKHQWSATQIAALFARKGCTRNAVIGKVNRLGLCRSKRSAQPFRPTPTKKKLDAEANGSVGKAPEAMAVPKGTGFQVGVTTGAQRSSGGPSVTSARPVEVQEPPRRARPKHKPVTIFDLLPHHCRWIDGQPDGAATLYCGSAAVPGSSYCEHHATAASGSGTYAERRALHFTAKRSQLTGANT